jgi:hypothetical protein
VILPPVRRPQKGLRHPWQTGDHYPDPGESCRDNPTDGGENARSRGRSETRCRSTPRRATLSNSPRRDSREDLRNFIRTLYANKSRGRSKRRCMNCGSTEPHGFQVCRYALLSICGHTRDRSGRVKVAQEPRSREDPAVRKRERSESVNAEQRRPRRPDRVTTPPRIKERVKETNSLEDSLTVL